MSVPAFPNFGKWSPLELQKAETAAIEFLDQNSQLISQTFEERLGLLQKVALRLKTPELDFNSRMLCLSLIDELARGLSESARGFFEIGCAPSVANIVNR